ncbi:hypothetical protein B0H14DRAFT_2569362 [Mycena olivaceomarginata]|nr:hypothetical protein B0H14DRAFT_2569362 [Mycena olivaceomarginata]
MEKFEVNERRKISRRRDWEAGSRREPPFRPSTAPAANIRKVELVLVEVAEGSDKSRLRGREKELAIEDGRLGLGMTRGFSRTHAIISQYVPLLGKDLCDTYVIALVRETQTKDRLRQMLGMQGLLLLRPGMPGGRLAGWAPQVLFFVSIVMPVSNHNRKTAELAHPQLLARTLLNTALPTIPAMIGCNNECRVDFAAAIGTCCVSANCWALEVDTREGIELKKELIDWSKPVVTRWGTRGPDDRLSLPSCLSAGLPNVGRVLVRTIQNAKNTEVGLTLYNGVNWEHRLLANIFRNLNDPGSLLSLGVQISIDPRKLSWQTIVALSKRNLELLDLVQQPNGLSKKASNSHYPHRLPGTIMRFVIFLVISSTPRVTLFQSRFCLECIRVETSERYRWDWNARVSTSKRSRTPHRNSHFKMTAQVQDCHSVLTAAGLLYGMLDPHHIESGSKPRHNSYKVGTKSQPRTSEESEIWEWCRALRTAFFNRTASDFETKPSVHEYDVEEVHQLFRIMNSTLVSPLYIKKIKQRRDEFGRHAQELYNKWVNVCSDYGST